MVAQAAIYAIPRFPVYNTVFTVKTFVLDLQLQITNGPLKSGRQTTLTIVS